MITRTLLRESYDAKTLIVEDQQTKEKKYYIEGICAQSEIVNGNKRVYPKEIVDREFQKHVLTCLDNGRSVGELNHPDENPEINPRFISHKFVSLHQEGNNWIAKALIAEKTDMGRIVAGLIDCGITLGISTRGTGSTKMHNGISVVQDDFCLISPGDIVWEPSAPDAFLEGLMEKREWAYANGKLFAIEKQLQEKVNKLSKNKQLTKENATKLFGIVLNHIRRNQ